MFVELLSKPVTAGTDQIGGDFYIEEPDRSCGIRVRPQGLAPVAEGDCVSVVGRLDTLPSGERAIVDANVRMAPVQTPLPTPPGMPNRSVGGGDFFYDPGPPKIGQIGVTNGFGLNNIGLLVKTWGRVKSTDSQSNSFTINDGSNIDLKCLVPTHVSLPSPGQYVCVTGVSSCEQAEDEVSKLLLIRKQSDVQVQN